MQEGGNKDGQKARFLRKAQKEAGQDQQEQEEDKHFQINFEKAIKTHSKKLITKDIQKQIEYFDYKIEPFNMKQQQQMGQVDQEGFFVFSRKRQFKDAWLQSLKENEEDNGIDQIRKRVKEQNRYQTVYDGDKKKNQQYNSEDEEDDNKENPGESAQEQQPEQKQILLNGNQIKMLLSQLLPFGTHANKHMKDLKKSKNQELYDKILFLCNEYIEVTGEHDIFTMKKEELEQAFDQQESEKPLDNWDNNDSPQLQKKKQKNNEENSQDDIF